MTMKKVIALGLTGALTLGMMGCAKQNEANSNSKTPSTSVTEGDNSKSNSSNKSDSVGNSKETNKNIDSGEKIKLRWYLAGSGPQADVETVQSEINTYLMDKYGMNVELELIMTDFANYPQKMQMVISSGEEYDICWTSGWNNNYYDNVNKNAFVELDDMLTKYAPELKASMDDTIWEGAKVDGKIYGIPSQQIFPKQNYLVLDKAYVDEYNFDLSKVTKLSDCEDFFMQVKADHPDIYPFAASSNGLIGKLNLALGYEFIIGNKIPGVLAIDGENTKIVNQYTDMESQKEFYEMMYRWQKAGIVRQDAATVSDNAVPDIKAGKHIATVNATFKPGVEATEKGNFGGREIEIVKLSEGYTATDSINASLNSISRTSKNPETAMKFLNLVNSDAVLYNMLCFGVEGTHYTLDGEGKAVSDDAKGYNPNVDWMFGNQFNAIVREGQDDNIWEETKKINESAKQSRINGFSFDSTKVTNELAAISAVIDQYALPLETGAVDPEKALPEFVEKLKTAGSEKLIAEMQAQLDEWTQKN